MPSGLHRQRYRLIIATFEFRTEDLLSIDTHQYRIVLGRNSQSEPEEEKHPKQSNHKHHPFFLYGCKYKQNARKAAISLRIHYYFVIILLWTAIVRCLTGYRYIMRMAFEYTCISNAGKLGIVQFLYIGCTAIAHTGTQTANQLINHFIQSTFIRNAGSNASGTNFFTSLVPLWK